MESYKFKFIDLFAGIGGFHLAMHELGGECVFASEMDKHARTTYEHNFRKISPELFKNDMFNDDIRKVSVSEIPDFDVLCAGFPCQPFSQAGYKRGFDDNHSSERGNLFFNITEILDEKRPKAFFLENVRGIVNHDNGNTFKVIRNILENELGYSFYFKVVKATDYGLPQHRPRAFMIGFRDEGFMRGFEFPPNKPLKYNMSYVWGGICSRDIGFTLRVGGRGSSIHDRRNWDAYLVNNEVKQLSSVEGKRMQGFPEDFEFPVSETQAIKQLGNSVAVDAVYEVARQMINYLNVLEERTVDMKPTKNRGEWTELLVFVKLILEKELYLSDSNLVRKEDFFRILKVTNENIDEEYILFDNSTINIQSKKGGIINQLDVSSFLNEAAVIKIIKDLKQAKGRSFELENFKLIQDGLGLSIVKGGNSNQKRDIILDINHDRTFKLNQGFGIKSYLGSKPTLLNASGNTNFIFEVIGFDEKRLDEVNHIESRHKLMDRLKYINAFGGELVYRGAEKESMDYNLKIVDTAMPEIIGEMLLGFYRNRKSDLPGNLRFIHKRGKLSERVDYGDYDGLVVKAKNLLINVLLGFFAGQKWDGEFSSNGTIVMKENGEILAFHVVDLKSLKEYLFTHMKFDTPSMSRHRYGKLYKEKNGKLFFKLNLQLRFK